MVQKTFIHTNPEILLHRYCNIVIDIIRLMMAVQSARVWWRRKIDWCIDPNITTPSPPLPATILTWNPSARQIAGGQNSSTLQSAGAAGGINCPIQDYCDRKGCCGEVGWPSGEGERRGCEVSSGVEWCGGWWSGRLAG